MLINNNNDDDNNDETEMDESRLKTLINEEAIKWRKEVEKVAPQLKHRNSVQDKHNWRRTLTLLSKSWIDQKESSSNPSTLSKTSNLNNDYEIYLRSCHCLSNERSYFLHRIQSLEQTMNHEYRFSFYKKTYVSQHKVCYRLCFLCYQNKTNDCLIV
jgi:hypothetical protein